MTFILCYVTLCSCTLKIQEIFKWRWSTKIKIFHRRRINMHNTVHNFYTKNSYHKNPRVFVEETTYQGSLPSFRKPHQKATLKKSDKKLIFLSFYVMRPKFRPSGKTRAHRCINHIPFLPEEKLRYIRLHRRAEWKLDEKQQPLDHLQDRLCNSWSFYN